MGFLHTCGDVGSFGELLDDSESAGRPSLLKMHKIHLKTSLGHFTNQDKIERL